MRKKTSAFVVLLIILIFTNYYVLIEYEINLIEYINKSRGLNDEELKWLDQHGEIIYGSDYSSPPLRYKNDIDGQYRGLVVDYIRALSLELGKEVQFKPNVYWYKNLEGLEKDETDFVDMIDSEERSKKFYFSDSIYNLRETLVFKKGEYEIRGYEDLKEKKVAIPKADYVYEYLKSKKVNAEYVFTEDMEQAINKLISGEVDVVAGDEPVIAYFLENMNIKNTFQTLDEPLFEKTVRLAVNKSDTILLSILNKAIFNLKKKDIMVNIQQKWLGMSVEFNDNSSKKISLIILMFITFIVVILYFFSSWNLILKREVERRTEELYVSRNNLQTTFDGLTHLMIVIDRKHTVVYINKAFCEMVKIKRRNIMGERYVNFTDILSVDENKCIIQDTFNNARHYTNEFQYKGAVFEMSTYPLKDYESEFMNILIMIQDVTNIRLVEKQLLHEDKMAAVGQLAAGVAHEVRNPLGLIRNYCYILKKNIGKDKEKVDKAIKVIESSVEKSSDIINNLLNFSRISNYNYKETNIKEFILSILSLERKIFEKNNINYEILCNEKLNCYINLEALKHIFINLISNSVDAMSDGGNINIECKKQKSSLDIIFRDTGCGIRKEDLENIFNPFFTTKPSGKGIGLGMYITYNEIHKCGGKIRVESELGKGTIFYISLPTKEVKVDERV